MPSTLSYPGVYIEEIPSGVRTIAGVATSITAFVGYTAKGSVNKATRIFNFGDYEREFGGLHRDSDVSYAVQQFFMNGGGDAYVVRVAGGAAAAAVDLLALTGGAVALTARARNEGDWGNLLRIEVDYATSSPANLFNLSVGRWNPDTQTLVDGESYANLSLNSRSANYAPALVNDASRLITLTRGGVAFGKGYSQSGDLSAVALANNETRIRGRVDDEVDFELVMATGGNTFAKILNRVTAAISGSPAANGRITAGGFKADGSGDNTNGPFLRLISTTTDDFSSVVVVPALTDDATTTLGLGLAKGGVEIDGTAAVRPAPSGTTGGDITVTTPVGGAVTVQIDDHSSGAPVLLESAPVAVTAAAFGPALRDNLQAAIRGMTHPAAKSATVRIQGRALQVTASDAWPGVTFTLTDTGATALKMPGAGTTLNVSRYVPGAGPVFSAQAGLVKGSDGNPPGVADFKGSFNAKTGIYALRDVDLFNLLCIPSTARLTGGVAAVNSLIQEATAFCEAERAFYIIDPPSTVVDAASMEAWLPTVTSSFAAVYFPRLLVADPLQKFRVREMPASGAVAGVYARTDAQRGIWKAPAGTDAALNGTAGLSLVLTDPEQGPLNTAGANVLRYFPVYGRVVWGARTRSGASDNTGFSSEYRYVPVRRLALYLEESLFRGTQWVVFEPNDEPLWAQIRMNLGAFMNTLFRQGAFQGKTPRDAYLVKCDGETTTQNDIDRGVVNILVAFAPLKPAEFVVIRIQQKAQIPA